MAGRVRGNADLTRSISKSIFVTNFPDNTSSKDMWNLCQGYGTVVDVYIPNRLSKAGKRFAFVRFIKVENVDRLVGNLCTLWIGRMHLHANVVRFERSYSRPSQSTHPYKPVNTGAPTFASALKGTANLPPYISSSHALVLDDSCVVSRQLDNYVMGEVKQFSSINNLRVLLSNEGFPNVKLAYLGGLWVMIELESLKSKAKFMKHVGVASWFVRLCNAQSDFVSRERIVWVDIEGVPLHVWSRATFNKIGSKWGEVMELKECLDDCFGRKRICIRTKQEDNILERFKIIVHGKIFVGRAKELSIWTPIFNEVKDVVYCTDDESVKGGEEKNGGSSNHVNSDDECDVEGVSDTYFGDSDDKHGNEHNQVHTSNDKETSPDPFNIYNLLKKRDDGVVNSGADTSIPFPPGFTPERKNNSLDKQEVNDTTSIKSQMRSDEFCSRVVENAQDVDDCHSSDTDSLRRKMKSGGSILEVLDDMINVGHTMGYTMEGCIKDMEKVIGLQGGHDGLQ
ncbi:RNA-directed DNA polymerase, eukaryota [Tanacetum coccineum]